MCGWLWGLAVCACGVVTSAALLQLGCTPLCLSQHECVYADTVLLDAVVRCRFHGSSHLHILGQCCTSCCLVTRTPCTSRELVYGLTGISRA
jgi:hypothetical protein